MNNDIKSLTNKEIMMELKEWYSSKELAKMLDVTEATISNLVNDKSEFAKTNSTKLKDFFAKHVQEHSSFEMIKDVYSSWENLDQSYMVDTPDGFQYASRFIKKDSRTCYDLRAVNYHIECSGDHLIETDKGWVKTENIKKGDRILTRVGFEEVQVNEQIADSEVYDMTIEHENHRYWGGAGISSHNSGKSFLMSKAIADAQKEGYMVAVLDSEQAVSQDYLQKIGVDTDPSMLITVQVQTVEQTQDMLLEVLQSVKDEQKAEGKDKIKLMLIVDSIGALTSNKALENAEKGHHAVDMGTKAKALTNMFNQVVQKIGITDTVCMMTNHGAMEVGVMFPVMKPKGGQSCEFMPSISLRVTKGKIKPTDLAELEYLYEGGIPKHLNALGIVSKIELYKSRFTRPFRKVQLMIPYDFGLPEFAGAFDYLKDNGIIIEGDRKGYYNSTLVHFEKDFSRKAFIRDGFAQEIMNVMLEQEKKGHIYDFIMKSSDEIALEKAEAEGTITEEINDSVKS